MVLLSEFYHKDTTLSLIEDGEIVSDHREYLGMSAIGHSCARYLWYSFRWAYQDTYSQRIRRLFKRGHREEVEIVKELRRIGYTFSGDQDGVECAWGHCKGHRDGMVENVVEAPKTPHLFEAKTMNDKSFKDTQKRGTRVSKPVYYAQCQIYMKFFKLARTLFIAVNKNDDSYIIERFRYDAGFAKDLVGKAEMIVMLSRPPVKPFSPTWFECKFCSANGICHRNQTMERNCRTCTQSVPIDLGYWRCDKFNEKLDVIKQKKGCDEYDGI